MAVNFNSLLSGAKKKITDTFNEVTASPQVLQQRMKAPQVQANVQRFNQARGGNTVTPLQNTAMQYVQNRVALPAQSFLKNTVNTFKPNQTLPQRAKSAGTAALSGLQTAFGATNTALPFAGIDAIKGAAFNQRTKQNPLAGAQQGFTGSKFFGAGDALTGNAPLAMVGNIAEMALPFAKSGKAGFGKKFTTEGMHPEDVREISIIKAKLPTAKSELDAYMRHGQTIDRLAERYLDTAKNLKNMSFKQKLEALSDRAAYDFDSRGMRAGIVGKVENPKDPFFNVNRMGVKDEVKEGVAASVKAPDLARKIKDTVGDTLSFKEIQAKAKVSKDLGKTYTRADTEKLGSEALALRNRLSDLSQMGLNSEQYQEALIKDKAFGQYVARLLGQRRIISNPEDKSIFNSMVTKVLKTGVDPDEVTKAAKGVDFNDSEQATAFFRKFIKATPSDWVDLLRYNSMLSSPNTHIFNVSSNLQGTGIIAPVEKTITGGLDWLRSTATRTPRQYRIGEGAQYAAGYYGNLGNAAKRFADVLSGKALSSMSEIQNVPLSTGGPKRGVENVLRSPGRLLQAMDEFFQTMTQAGAQRALDYRQAGGITIKEAGGAFNEGRKRLFNAEFNQKDEGYLLRALEAIPQKIQELRSSDNPVVSTIAKYTIPFVRVPTNVLKQSVEYSPAGLLTLPGASAKTEQLSKAILGSSFGLGAALLVSSDRMTWAEPVNSEQRNAYRAAGLQPYAIKVGNDWVSYSRLHPSISFPLALVAAVRDAEKNKNLSDDQVDTVLQGAGKWMNFYADQSFVKNIGDFVAAAKGDSYGVSKLASNYPSQLIPFRALLSWVNRIVDPYQRQADPDGSMMEKQLQQIAAQIPGLSQSVPTRKDRFGKPIENQNRLLNAVSPARVTTENPRNKQVYDILQQQSANTRLKEQIRAQYKQENPTQPKTETIESFLAQANQGTPNYIPITKNGEVVIIDANRVVQKPRLTGDDETDKRLMSTYKADLTRKRTEIADLYKAGKLTADEASTQIGSLDTPKSTGSGSRRGATIRKTSAPSIKIPTVRSSPIKLAKVSFKGTRIKPRKKSKRISFKIKKRPKLKLTLR